ncbi:MAG: hypothetical protein WAK33_25895, partial [Silvibacterium sp.]
MEEGVESYSDAMVDGQGFKIQIDRRMLWGSGNPHLLQRVATLYTNGHEYRVYAPPEARGPAGEWMAQFAVKEPVDFNAESDVHE